MHDDFLLGLLEGWLGHHLVVPASGMTLLIPILVADALSAYVRPINWRGVCLQALVLVPGIAISPFPAELMLVPAALSIVFWALNVRHRVHAEAFVDRVDALMGCFVVALALCVGLLMFGFGLFSGEKQWLLALDWIVAFIAFVLAAWRWRTLRCSHLRLPAG